MLFLTQAAQTAQSGGSMLTTFFLPLVLMVVVFYFLILRPQQKRNKERNLLLSNIKVGDKIVTIGGLHGIIEELHDVTVVIKTADGTRLTFDRSAINNIQKEKVEKDKVDLKK